MKKGNKDSKGNKNNAAAILKLEKEEWKIIDEIELCNKTKCAKLYKEKEAEHKIFEKEQDIKCPKKLSNDKFYDCSKVFYDNNPQLKTKYNEFIKCGETKCKSKTKKLKSIRDKLLVYDMARIAEIEKKTMNGGGIRDEEEKRYMIEIMERLEMERLEMEKREIRDMERREMEKLEMEEKKREIEDKKREIEDKNQEMEEKKREIEKKLIEDKRIINSKTSKNNENKPNVPKTSNEPKTKNASNEPKTKNTSNAPKTKNESNSPKTKNESNPPTLFKTKYANNFERKLHNLKFTGLEILLLKKYDEYIRSIIKILQQMRSEKECNFEPKELASKFMKILPFMKTLPFIKKKLLYLFCNKKLISLITQEKDRLKSLCNKKDNELQKFEIRHTAVDIFKKMIHILPNIFQEKDTNINKEQNFYLFDRYDDYRIYLKKKEKGNSKLKTNKLIKK